MINITLPNFHYNYKIINFFTEVEKNFPQSFKYPTHFTYAAGNLPYCYWYGGYNINIANGPVYDDIIRCGQNISLPLRFNCSNICLTDDNLNDTLGNLILQHAETGSNIIELSNLAYLEYFQKKYPYYKYILSKNAQLLMPLDADNYNIIEKDSNLYLISLNEQHSCNLEFLKLLNNPRKYELQINSVCDCNCSNYMECQKLTHASQYNYSKFNHYKSCKNHKDYHLREPLLGLDNIINDYVPLGFINYNIADVINDNQDNLLVFLVNYFIKEEFVGIILETAICKGVLND